MQITGPVDVLDNFEYTPMQSKCSLSKFNQQP